VRAFKGFTNRECEFFPCHTIKRNEFNCLFCYCPLAKLQCPGPYKVLKGKYGIIKDCSNCTLNHDGYEQSWKMIQMWASTAPPWDQKEQTDLKRFYYSKLVKNRFDFNDLLIFEANNDNAS